MTAEIPKAPRTHAGVVSLLTDFPAVRKAWIDSSEPYTTIRITVSGVGASPLIQRELSMAGLSITSVGLDSDETTEITARRIFRRDKPRAGSAERPEQSEAE